MASNSASLTLHLEKVLPAAPEEVFDAYIDPAKLAGWWGPAGFTSPGLELDAREGGRFRISMQPPRGEAFHLRGEFREIACQSIEEVWEAIHQLRVRGAPAIGIAKACGWGFGVRPKRSRSGSAAFSAPSPATSHGPW